MIKGKSRVCNRRDNQEEVYIPPEMAGIILIFVVMALVLFGIIMLYSVTAANMGTSMLIKQLMWAILGIVCAVIINIAGYKKIIRIALPLIILSCILLIAARFSRPINGAYRWIQLPGGFGNIQPSELAKLSVILYLSYYLPKYQRFITRSFVGVFKAIFFVGITTLLVLVGMDLGTTVLICVVIWSMLFVSGVRFRFLLPPLIIIPVLPIILKHYSKVRWDRITSFMNPELYEKTIGYQLWLSILAMGSGSWSGLGFSKSRMKAQYLPESHTDFILSIIGEELGYIAILAVLAGYILFFIIAMYISFKAKDKEGKILAFAIGVIVVLQAAINLGVVSGAFPTKGISAPFISYGGSNMIISLIFTGLLISISRDRCEEKTKIKDNIRLGG